MITIIVLGVLVGAVLGLTGAGGGIFAVPALVYGLGWGVAQASPVALLAVAGAAGVGAIEGLRNGLVRYKAAALMAVTGVSITSLGVKTAHALSEPTLLLCFAAAMLAVSIRMYRGSRSGHVSTPGDESHPVPCHLDPETGKLHWTMSTAAVISAIGFASGFLTGLLGVGGGFVIVPALRQFTDISLHGIVATSLMVIALVAGGAVLVMWGHGSPLPWSVAAPFVGATAVGMVVGRIGVRHLPAQLLQRTFSLLIGVVAVSFAIKAFRG